jgi:adenine/guanine phosphoribosyltransferase-like PRPP-binding protein
MSVDLLRYVRDVADFPKPGIVFKDMTPLLADARAFAASIEALVAPFVAEIAFLDGRARWMHEAPLHAVLRF